jgi:serine phosphatase RsbU (regulator of sigma subunit)/Tfp pilus assembly protein PilF
MRQLIYILFILLPFIGVSQKTTDNYYLVDTSNFNQLVDWELHMIDSFIPLINKEKTDTGKIIAIHNMYSNMNDNDVWVLYLKEINKILETKGFKEKNQNFYFKYKGKYYNDIGYYYKFKGLINQALENYHKGLIIARKHGKNDNVATVLINLGALYLTQNDYEKALDNFNKGYELMKLEKDSSGMAVAVHNMGSIYLNTEKFDLAIKKYKEAAKINRELKQYPSLSNVYNSLGSVYFNIEEMDSAFYYFYEGLKIRRRYKNILSMTNSMTSIGRTYYWVNDLEKAQNYADSALLLANQLPYPEYKMQASNLQYQVHKKKGNWKKALEMHEVYFAISDSMRNDETRKAVSKQQAMFEYEKQKAVDDAENEKKIATEQEAKEKQIIITYATAGGLGLVGLFLIIVFNRLKVTRKQKAIIEEQKEVVELAHHELGEKNQEIMDSITYAKRIQNAILPPLKVVKEYLQESFILYKPKDIVAGDFYWLEHNDGKILFAAADCTGHGVPGAMVSVVCNNGLNRSVREYGLTDPGEILNKTREIVIAEFEKSEDEVKDGMDIALCSLEGNILKYAGANNPLWIIRNNEIIETKADKQPIGKFDELLPYTTHTFELQKGDSIYVFSDGYVDQFGGEKGKKFKAAAFRTLLLSIQTKSMEEQQTIINNAFEDWKGSLEQIDDVCIIGVKI